MIPGLINFIVYMEYRLNKICYDYQTNNFVIGNQLHTEVIRMSFGNRTSPSILIIVRIK